MTDPTQRTPKLRGGIVGYGFIAERGHVPAYAATSRLEIVAVADMCAERRERAKAALPHARIYEDHASMIAGEKGNLDFVDVTTPPCDHAKIARAALTAGLHVLCEKPLATSSDDARSLAAEARAAKRVLFPCHNYKHAPVVKAVRQVLEAGLVGKVRLVTLDTFRNTHAKGVAEWRPDWRREKRFSGGGIAMDHGSHTFYLAFDWLGGYPSSITAKMSSRAPFDTEDQFSCALTFPEGGVAVANLTWNAGVRKVIYTIHGDRGAIRIEDDDVEVAIMGRGDDGLGPFVWERKKEQFASAWMDAGHSHWFQSMLGEFADAIARGDYVSKDTQDSLRCIEVISAAYESAKARSVEVPLGG